MTALVFFGIGSFVWSLSFVYRDACTFGYMCCITVFMWVVLLQYLPLFASDIIIN